MTPTEILQDEHDKRCQDCGSELNVLGCHIKCQLAQEEAKYRDTQTLLDTRTKQWQAADKSLTKTLNELKRQIDKKVKLRNQLAFAKKQRDEYQDGMVKARQEKTQKQIFIDDLTMDIDIQRERLAKMLGIDVKEESWWESDNQDEQIIAILRQALKEGE